jgi:hypothetical protein
VLNLVMGKGATVGQAMLDSPDLAGLTFTGSTGTGKRVAFASIEHNRKFQLEMGGKNPFVVLDDADLHVAVEAAASSGFFATGQRCTASSRIIVTEGIHDRFVAALTERLAKINVGHAMEKETHVGPVVDENQLKQDTDYIEIGKKEGAKLAFGGDLVKRSTPGFYLQPALFTEATNQMRISREGSASDLPNGRARTGSLRQACCWQGRERAALRARHAMLAQSVSRRSGAPRGDGQGTVHARAFRRHKVRRSGATRPSLWASQWLPRLRKICVWYVPNMPRA